MHEKEPIKTEEEYEKALKEIENLFEAEPNSPEGGRLDELVTLVEQYEDIHYSIPPSTKSQTDWEALNKMTDADINFSDTPEITKEQMAKATKKINGKLVE